MFQCMQIKESFDLAAESDYTPKSIYLCPFFLAKLPTYLFNLLYQSSIYFTQVIIFHLKIKLNFKYTFYPLNVEKIDHWS